MLNIPTRETKDACYIHADTVIDIIHAIIDLLEIECTEGSDCDSDAHRRACIESYVNTLMSVND